MVKTKVTNNYQKKILPELKFYLELLLESHSKSNKVISLVLIYDDSVLCPERLTYISCL